MVSKDADSDALRARRRRAHKRGDHSLCRPEVCRDATDGRAVVADVKPADEESMVAAVVAFVEALPPGREGGPQIVMGRAAVRLAEAIDASAPGLAGNVRELHNVLAHLGDTADSENHLDEVRARRAHRRAEMMLDARADV